MSIRGTALILIINVSIHAPFRVTLEEVVPLSQMNSTPLKGEVLNQS